MGQKILHSIQRDSRSTWHLVRNWCHVLIKALMQPSLSLISYPGGPVKTKEKWDQALNKLTSSSRDGRGQRQTAHLLWALLVVSIEVYGTAWEPQRPAWREASTDLFEPKKREILWRDRRNG